MSNDSERLQPTGSVGTEPTGKSEPGVQSAYRKWTVEATVVYNDIEAETFWQAGKLVEKWIDSLRPKPDNYFCDDVFLKSEPLDGEDRQAD